VLQHFIAGVALLAGDEKDFLDGELSIVGAGRSGRQVLNNNKITDLGSMG
jgi:hypothetical protein